jgi:hypothetical protein
MRRVAGTFRTPQLISLDLEHQSKQFMHPGGDARVNCIGFIEYIGSGAEHPFTLERGTDTESVAVQGVQSRDAHRLARRRGADPRTGPPPLR